MDARSTAARIANGGVVKRSGGGWMVPCPAHDDSNPSLSITDGDQKVVMKCHAGCLTEDVLAAAGMEWADLSDEQDAVTGNAPEVTYDYTGPSGSLLYQVVRRVPKKFLQRRPDPDNFGEWVWNLRGVDRVLYRLPAVIDAVRNGLPVWITEGEKDAGFVAAQGVCATTCPQGAGKWQDSFSETLSGADVTIWADADEPGRKHAREVRTSLIAHGVASVRIVESAHGKDAADHLSHGLTLDDVLVTVPHEDPEPPALFMRVDEFLDQEVKRGKWVIPGYMRAGERVIFTGYEGYGKSALLKQFAVCAAIGLDPFVPMAHNGDGSRVMFIDCENPCDDMMEDFWRLKNAAGKDWKDPDLFIECHPPMNLGDVVDAAWLAEQTRAHQPDLLVIGPLYNLMNGDSSKEVEVSRMLRVLSLIQHEVGCAVALEHHAPHAAEAGEEHRTVRPIGSSILRRWPSYGYGLIPTNRDDPHNNPFQLQAWRGARRRGRSWPEHVTQAGNPDGTGWYWQELVTEKDQRRSSNDDSPPPSGPVREAEQTIFG